MQARRSNTKEVEWACFVKMEKGLTNSCLVFICLCGALIQAKSPFTWKEDDPSARITLEDSFGLHAKTRLLGSTFHLVYMQDF